MRNGSSSACADVPGEQNNGWRGFVASDQRFFPIGRSSMSAAEHQKPCELRGSCTVLGARGGEIPPRDSPGTDICAAAFIDRIERGFDFLGYHFSPMRLTVAKKDDRELHRESIS